MFPCVFGSGEFDKAVCSFVKSLYCFTLLLFFSLAPVLSLNSSMWPALRRVLTLPALYISVCLLPGANGGRAPDIIDGQWPLTSDMDSRVNWAI